MKINKSIGSLIAKVNRAMLPFISVIIISTIIISTLISNPALAQENAAQTNPSAVNDVNRAIESGELERFVDNSFQETMQQYQVPGAVISIVKDGKVVLSKGYGYADLEKKTAVFPDKTLFRIGSVTKVFTANAVMQLVEQGKIDLNKDVNNYLVGFKVINNYPEKVTMAQLLTHTSGIDNDVIGDLSKTDSGVKPLAQVLKKRMLPVVSEPGRFIQYSDYGIALAGCIMEEVSANNCSDYIKNHILTPLGMNNTSFQLNSTELATGYVISDGSIKPQELKGYFNLYPVGGIISTADDMSKFMIAHLDNGEYHGKRILKEATAIEMHSRHASFDPLLPGTCYGFYEGSRNGQRTIGHAGYSPDGFSTELSLFPDDNLGIFISINQGSNNSFPQDFVNDLIDHYFPVTDNISKTNSNSQVVNKKIEGTYRFSDYTKSTLNKGDIFGNGTDVKILMNDNGTITLNEVDPFTQKKTSSIASQVTPLVFEKKDGSYVVFKQDKEGNIAYMAQTPDSWHGTYARISWYDKNFFQIGLFIGCLIIFLVQILLGTVFSIKRLLKKHKTIVSERCIIVRHLSSLVGLNSFLNVMFFAISMMTWGERLRYGIPLDVKLLLMIPIITSMVSVVITIGSIISWKNKSGSLFFRMNASAATIASLIFVWFYTYWNLLGFKY